MLRHRLATACIAVALASPSGAQTPDATVTGLWSLEPLPPAWRDATPAAIDELVDARLQTAGLQRRPPADRRTLLRRASLLLTGLPPTPEAVAAFVADGDPDAFARRVDELLASTACAEHLARRWLDLARYSDSNGLDENLAFGEAWRYRDWVVRALHDDLPFDRFGTLQLAGDLLPDDDPAPIEDRLVATGFLAMGPRMLAEQDKDKLVLDTIDEQVDLVGRTFLGLTLGCARCHDHKFDPVPTRDYYALAGIFKSTRSFDNLDHVSRWVERPIATPAAVAARTAALDAQQHSDRALAEFDRECAAVMPERLAAQIGDYLRAGLAAGECAILRQAESADHTNLARDEAQWGKPGCAVLHTKAAGLQFADYEITAIAGKHRLEVRMASKESRPLRVLVDGAVCIERALEQTTGDWFPAQQHWFVAGMLELTAGAHVLRLEGIGPHMPHLDKWLLAPVAADGPQWPANVTAAQGLAAAVVRNAAFAVREGDFGRTWSRPAGNDGLSADRWQAELAAVWLPFAAQQAELRAVGKPATAAPEALAPLLGPGGVFELRDDELQQLLSADQRAVRAGLVATQAAARAAVPPPPPMALCVGEGTPTDLPVHLRGSHLTLAHQPTPRGFLSALAGALPPPAIADGHSGRLELAQWLFDPRHPLTARVAVNRLWQLLFGEGLARSESNFGVRGEPPSHPELLDLLAATFVADNWSVRRMLRRIVLSGTWQQQSSTDEHAADIDPEDRLLWRQRRQRLPAEAIRDSMLMVAGTLDRSVGGSLLSIDNRAYVTNDQSKDAARYDAPRRSLYLPVIRNAMYDLYTVFDYADPSVHQEQRPQSTTATQALLLLNSPFVVEQSAAFARHVEPDAGGGAATDAARIDAIFQRALQRDPTPNERAAVRRWLADAPPTQRWQGLCQTLFAANEFVYVD